MKNSVIYPGTFDPITLGHIDIVHRARRLFDHITIAIAHNHNKKPLFNLQERLNLIQNVFKDCENIEATSFDGLLTNFAKQKNINVIIRSIRVISDFDYEFQMASMNRVLTPDLETVFLTPADRYTYISSTMVREIAFSKGNLSAFVPPIIEEALRNKFE